MNTLKWIRQKLKNPLIRFLLLSSAYTIWVAWIKIYFLLLGNIILFDICLTNFINWRFWRKRLPFGKRQSMLAELSDAFIWAALLTIFVRVFMFEAYTIATSSMEKTLRVGDYYIVNKLRYGPRMPLTPITIPFTHNALPFSDNAPSYLPFWQLNYKRLSGFNKIKNYDVVLFNYPEGDTVIRQYPEKSYYSMARQFGIKHMHQYYDLVYRPVDKRDNYVKRVIGIPGDSIQIEQGRVFVNRIPEVTIPGRQFNYNVKSKKQAQDDLYLDRLGVSPYDITFNDYNSIYSFPLTKEMYRQLLKDGYFKAITRFENMDHTKANKQVFPFNDDFPWTEDNFGPVYVPKKHKKVKLTIDNLPLYERIISVYENNVIRIVDDSILYINDVRTNEYYFKMDYYFMLGDNRHNSNDSRYWGFVPENHIVGKATILWLSVDRKEDKSSNIRINRMFKRIH